MGRKFQIKHDTYIAGRSIGGDGWHGNKEEKIGHKQDGRASKNRTKPKGEEIIKEEDNQTKYEKQDSEYQPELSRKEDRGDKGINVSKHEVNDIKRARGSEQRNK